MYLASNWVFEAENFHESIAIHESFNLHVLTRHGWQNRVQGGCSPPLSHICELGDKPAIMLTGHGHTSIQYHSYIFKYKGIDIIIILILTNERDYKQLIFT